MVKKNEVKKMEQKNLESRRPFTNKVIPEINNGKRMVEDAGYVPRERVINNMIRAGERLDYLTSMGIFDVPAGKDPDDFESEVPLILRSKGVDLADFSAIYKTQMEKVKEIQKRLQESKGVKVETPPEQSGEVSQPKKELPPDLK